MGFEHKKIEKKWQEYWDTNKTFETDVYDFSKPKFYVLDMFPIQVDRGYMLDIQKVIQQVILFLVINA